MKKIVVAAVVLLAILFLGFLLVKKDSDDMNLQTKNSNTQTSPEPKVTDKPVTKDDSFTSIESDLNSTVILNEDFSDLK